MTDIKTTRFVRKTFTVDAVQVTADNIEAIAEWCKGELRQSKPKEGLPETFYVKVDVLKPLNDRQTRAYPGDWVFKAGKNGFKVYTNNAFTAAFDRAQTIIERGTEKKSPAHLSDEDVAHSL